MRVPARLSLLFFIASLGSPCGAAGQTSCYSDPSNATSSEKCNPGLTYNQFTNACQ